MFDLFISTAHAQAQGAPPPAGGGGFELLFFFGSIIGIWYFLVIRPQTKQASDHRTMVSALKKGDPVVMTSGMMGKVALVDDKTVTVEVGKGTKLRFLKDKVAMVGDPTVEAPAKTPAATEAK
ncbi:MAG: preprotein translocase subunit YajC [Proteobacteria bacterium]|nr:preprotein translocase subunit YajC [Pseudomonadota bacterium]